MVSPRARHLLARVYTSMMIPPHTAPARTCLSLLALSLVVVESGRARAQPVPQAVQLQRAQALGASSMAVSGALQRASQHTNAPSRQAPSPVEHMAQIEASLGLEFYRIGEDWRAISALQRYQLLARTQEAAFLGSLITGQIYDRNDRPSLAIESFSLATHAAPDIESGLWTATLETQQVCIARDLWQSCRLRLESLLDHAREHRASLSDDALHLTLLAQHAVARTMLHQEVGVLPEHSLESAALQEHFERLRAVHADFERLPLRRPWLAASMSALLPGSGQLYNREWGDALIAFSLNALFASATYYSFEKLESVPLGVTSALFLSGFYVGNIVNAKTVAEQHNARQYQLYFERVKREHWPRASFEIDRGEVVFQGVVPPSSYDE